MKLVTFGESNIGPADKVFWDASFICRLYFRDEDFHAECLSFARGALAHTMNYTSTLAVQEAVHAVVKDDLQDRYGKREWHGVYKNTHDISLNAAGAREMLELIHGLDLVILEVSQAAASIAPKIIKRSSILTADAFHLAVMQERSIPYLLTTDHDFARINEDVSILSCEPDLWKKRSQIIAHREVASLRLEAAADADGN